jgi:hypothetical protein
MFVEDLPVASMGERRIVTKGICVCSTVDQRRRLEDIVA